MIGEPFQSAILDGLPPMAVPMTVKMPEPMTAPMPSAVSETGPRVFLSECSGRSDSEMSLSILLVAKIWRGSGVSSSVEIYWSVTIVRCGVGSGGRRLGSDAAYEDFVLVADTVQNGAALRVKGGDVRERVAPGGGVGWVDVEHR
jgi:hypothetical protein